jgi:predicted Fe-Mo cluster-binding NifX family protein
MKIAVSSSGQSLDSQIDPRFGRCACFIIVETDDMNFKAFDNESIALGGGAGIQAAQFVASKGAKAVITGNCGPNAVRTLSASSVEVFIGQTGTVREAVEKYKMGVIKSTSAPNVTDHYGMGSGAGRGCGVEMGGGGGMGRKMGGSMPAGSGQPTSHALSREEELTRLKDQINELRKKAEEIEDRFNALEKE